MISQLNVPAHAVAINPCAAELFWVFLIHLKLGLITQFPALTLLTAGVAYSPVFIFY